MRLRILPFGKSLLAVGLLLSLTGCREAVAPVGSSAWLPGISPQPILAQIGEGYLQPADQPAATPAVSPGTETVPAPKVELPPEASPLRLKLSPGADEVVQLARAQLGDEVLLAYIENSPVVFNLKAEDILYLHDVGLSAPVIAAMIRHDQNLPAPAWDTPAPAPESTVAEVPSEVPQSEEAAPATAVAVSTAPAPASDVQVTHNYFYHTLSPYGTWVELPEYGWCWRPTVAVIDTSWRPYAHGGRWMYTDYGWYWHSYYSWGWAPFHYGRWHLGAGLGWVWVPDTHWGPAWVTWRHGGGYYGWAPLPPGAVYRSGFGLSYYGSSVSFGFGFGFSSHHYTFVPVRHFYSHRPWSHCVPHGRVGSVYNNTTIINNYVQGDGNNTVINVGPGTGAVSAATRTEIQKVKIREVASGEARLVRAESLSRDGTSLNVYRPRLPKQATTPPAEITRRQQELQHRSRAVAGSDSAQAAVIQARSSDRVLSPSLTPTPRTATGPSAAPRMPGSGSTGTRTESRREPAARPSGNVAAPASSPGSRVAPGTRIEPQRSVDRTVAPQGPLPQPATPRPGWSSPTPRIEPVRPPQASPAPASPRTRVEPSRTVNPSYSVTPRPSAQLTPRPYPGTPSPASPGTITPRSFPAPQPIAPRSEPRSYRQPSAPAPVRIAPSPRMSAPVRTPSPSVVPSRPSGAISPRPSPSPARSQPAPAPAPRSSGGTRNR